MVCPPLPALFAGSPSPVKNLLSGAIPPVGVDPHPAVALVDLDGDPVVEYGDPGVLAVFIHAGEGAVAAAVFVHDLAHVLEIIGVEGNLGFLALCLMVWRSLWFYHVLFQEMPPSFAMDVRYR